MAKAVKILTSNWQQISSGAAIFTIKQVGKDVVSFDTNQNDETAYKGSPTVGDQFEEREAIPMYAKGEGYEIIVDGSV